MNYSIFDIRDMTAKEYERRFAAMSAERQAKTLRFRLDEDRKRSVAADMLARRELSRLCGCPEEKISFETFDGGKPRAVGLPVCFNLSHSGNYALIALSTSEIGADIETAERYSERLLDKAFTIGERAFVEQCPELALRRFRTVWTAKEAYLKLTGRGIAAGLSSVETVSGMAMKKELFGHKLLCETNEDYSFSIVYNE